MNKNKFITGKKAVVLLSAIGVTATLLSPLALNTKVFANDETPQIASRTPGDARITENNNDSIYGQYFDKKNGYLDFFAMNKDKSILLNELTRIYNNVQSNADLSEYFNLDIPVGFSLNPNNEIDAKLIDIFSKLSSMNCLDAFYVRSEKNKNSRRNSLLYSIPIKSIDYSSIKSTITFPNTESLTVTNTYLKDLVVTGSTNILFDINLLSKYLPANEIYIHAYGVINPEKAVEKRGAYYLPNYDISNVKDSDFLNMPPYFYTLNQIYYTLDDFNCLYLTKNSEQSIGFISDTLIPLYDSGGYSSNSYINGIVNDVNDVESLKSYLRNAKKSYGIPALAFAFEKGDNKLNINKETFDTIKEYNGIFSIVESTNITNNQYQVSYRLTFNDIDTSLDFNPNLTYSVKDNNGVAQFQFDFEHSGALPGTMTVSAYVGTEYNKDTVYLYYINENNKLEKQEVKATIEGGYINFQINHCSSYLVSVEEVDENNNLLKSSNPENNTESTTPNTENNNVTDSTTNTTTDSQNSSTNTETKEDTEIDLTKSESPSTGDTTKTTMLLVSMAFVTVILIGIVILKKGNKKA